MKTGVIDIGTNTFHLLIADNGDKSIVLHDEKVAVRIGKDGISDGLIAPDAIERAIKTLIDFKSKLDHWKVDQVYTTATSAVRSAKNKEEFIATVKEKTGLNIEVLSGEEEAQLIHKGVTQFVDLESDTSLIVDIGGGSIEFIIADQKEIKWLKSYEIGGQRLIDQFHKSDPITWGEIMTLNHFLEEMLSDVFDQCELFDATFLIGSSGSFDTFWDIHQNKTSIDKSENPSMKMSEFMEIFEDLVSKTRSQRIRIPGMIEMRVDMIVGASIVTKNIMDHCGFDLIKISPFALKEGVLMHGLPKRK